MTMMKYMMNASVSRVLRGWYAQVHDLIPFYILNTTNFYAHCHVIHISWPAAS
jgi:hypothetical protein